MTVAPDPAEIFERAAEEGERRLDQTLLELVANSFIAGFTVVFGIVALGIVEALIPARYGGIVAIGGALAFGVALVFLIVGRTELFNENFFDPVSAIVSREDSRAITPLLRLWTLTFAFNLVGGGLFALVFTIDGTLPAGAVEILRHTAEEIAHRTATAEFAKGIVGGALVALLSYLLAAVNSVGSRMTLAYVVGVLLTLGPFDHVIVTILHVLFGVLFGADITLTRLAISTVAVTAGNLVGGVGLVTFSHVAEVAGADDSFG
ncbi:formate/nitrite transporter family protein [Haloarcula nitratireducens]|uniref:Formate/nitrite transporter family protein n=1 Tax=Haloarcula nitratireducens TaxID=2487749 RepID=A0AAW4PBL7_9EURY|nr:formate/nitrite transporter family protein [Halomicroarcula nitratireducens]MBX0295060.1 formate/nitrite transporter family protein [Halomicroarcula nitratireducens]